MYPFYFFADAHEPNFLMEKYMFNLSDQQKESPLLCLQYNCNAPAFSTHEALLEHIATVHKRERSFVCSQCGAGFYTIVSAAWFDPWIENFSEFIEFIFFVCSLIL